MFQLKLFLFGSPRIEQDNKAVEIGRRKALALLAYLAVTRQSFSRDALATLFWPDTDQSHARATLRRVLSDLNRSLGDAWLDTEGELVGLRSETEIWVDVAAFETLLAQSRAHAHSAPEICPACIPLLNEAVALYRDDFLGGFTLPDSPAFDEWQFFQAETLRRELAEALTRLVHYHQAQADFETAIDHARCWLSLDPLMEEAHRALMELYVYSGQRTAALRQYQECVRLLAEELGVEPASETRALHERIRRGELVQPQPEPQEAEKVEANEQPLSAPPTVLPEATALRSGERAPARPLASAPEAASLSPVEIRLVTVLFAGLNSPDDLAWDSHPEDVATASLTLRQLGAQLAPQYEARLEHVGADSLQLLFGLPHIHEDDSRRAIQAGLDLLAEARQSNLQISLGISSGHVLVNADTPHPPDRMAIGPVVNLAARLQAVATTGRIWVSPATYQQTRRTFVFQPLTLPVGGRTISAYEVIRPLPHPDKARSLEGLSLPLIGRDEELAQLKAALEKVQEEGQGQIVTLVGEAGLGKSRLVTELKQSLQQDSQLRGNNLQADDKNPKSSAKPPVGEIQNPKSRVLWLEGRCLEFRQATSYWPFIDLLQGYLAFCSEEFQGQPDCLVSVLQELVSQGHLSPERFDELAPLLGNLLSLHFGNHWDKRLQHAGPDQIRHQTFLAIYDFLVALARQQPLVLIFEDLHWADELSLQLLALLLEAIPTAPLLLLYIYRPELHHPSQRLARLAAQKFPQLFTELHLRELSAAESQALAKSLLGVTDLPSGLEDLLLEKAQGNPFFLEEALRSLIDAGAIYWIEEGWQARPGIEAVAVPESVQSIILSRLDRLEPELQQLLQHAAVMGRLFLPRVIAQTLPANFHLSQGLLALEEAAMIYQERVVPEVEYSFKHTLTQGTIYQTLSRQRRSSLHQQVAQAIEQLYSNNLKTYEEQLAYHYYHSEAGEKAIEYMIKAGQKSAAAYFNEEAIHYFKKALGRLETLPPASPEAQIERYRWQLAALTGLGQIYHGMGYDREAEQYLQQAIAVGGQANIPPREMVRLYHWLSEVLHWLGRHAEQVELGEAGLGLLDRTAVESVEAVLMNQAMAIGHYNLGNFDLFQELTRQTARLVQCLSYSPELRPAYIHIVIAHRQNRNIAEVNQWLERLEQLAQEHHDLRALAEVYEHRWSPEFERGQLQDSPLYFTPVIDLYLKVGDNSRLWRFLGSVILNFLMAGKLDLARQYSDQALDVARRVEHDYFIAETLLNLGLILACRQAWDRAIAIFQQADHLAQTPKSAWVKGVAAYCLGRIYLAAGQREMALEQLQAALSLADPHSRLEWRFKWWPLLACILSSLEAAFDSAAAFKDFCRSLPAARQQQINALVNGPWCLEPATPPAAKKASYQDHFRQKLASGWRWEDPFGGCSFRVQAGLELRAANGRDLWYMNRSAPRLLRQVEGDFAMQTICTPIPADEEGQLPPLGGLLLWQDRDNFLRLVWGNRGAGEISFEGCLNRQDMIIGQGWLPTLDAAGAIPSRVFLRLERQGDKVSALCSPDGEAWYSLGQASFPTTGPIEVGVHAIGWIDRTFYPGAYPDGAAIRFETFQLWRRGRK